MALAVALPAMAPGQEAAPVADPGDQVAAERGPAPPPPGSAEMFIRVYNASNGTVEANERVRVFARLKPFVPGEKVQVRITHGGKNVKRANLRVKRIGTRNMGKVKLVSNKILDPGDYRAWAVHKPTPAQERDRARSGQFHPTYPDLDPGNRNSHVDVFKHLLRKQGYYVSSGTKYDDATSRAVMAFRKVNGLSRTFNASSENYKTLADGKGRFHLEHPGAGRHVEVDISHQVMVLADHGKAIHTFHVSTGAPSTPSDPGAFRFYRRQAGYNSVGMYYSVYYNRGEAIHGYHSVPAYNASHGCIRNPIPNSVFIYNWVSIGMPIYVYS